MHIYKSLQEYANSKGIHKLTATQRLKSGKVIEIFCEKKKVGYIEVVEGIQILSGLL